MATSRILVGSEETKRDLVKTLHRDHLIETIGLNDIINGLLEEWVGRKGEYTTLQEFANILEENAENGLKDCGDTLVKGIIAGKEKTTSDDPKKRTIHKYCKLPTGLPEFLTSTSKLCILHTLDSDITCEKLIEKVENHCVYDYIQFLEMLSSPEKRDGHIIDVVKNCPMKRLKQLNNLCASANNKVVLVTCEEQKLLMQNLNCLCLCSSAHRFNKNVFLFSGYILEILLRKRGELGIMKFCRKKKQVSSQVNTHDEQ